MAYLSLYRKWRPQTFDDVVGQEHVVRTLVNALNEGRTAHAYLFCGPRGTGKTTVARLLAKGLNCDRGPTGDVCNSCDNCRRVTNGTALDVIEIDGASNRGIDEVREIRERVHYAPTQGRYKVYIVDEVHMLTNEAFNALLKILEEPPAHVVFVFATTEVHKIPATITSRCQKFDFHRFRPQQLVGQLRKVLHGEGIPFEDEALDLVARHAEGGMRDALAVLDQCIAYQPEKVTAEVVNDVLGSAPRERLLEFFRYTVRGDLGSVIALVREIDDSAVDLRQFVRDLIGYLRDLMIMRAVGTEGDSLITLLENEKDAAKELAQQLSLEQIIEGLRVLGQVETDMRWAPSPILALEMASVRLVELVRGMPQTAVGRPVVAQERKQAVASPGHPIRQADGERAVTGDLEGQRLSGEEVERRTTEGVSQDEQRPAVRATQATPSAPALVDRSLQSLWDQLLLTLRNDRLRQAEAFLREASPVKLTESALVAVFPENRSFHYDSANLPEHKQPVERVLSRLAGRVLRLELYLGAVPSDGPQESEGAPEATSRPADPGSDAARSSGLQLPVVKAALELFGGSITEVRREEENES